MQTITDSQRKKPLSPKKQSKSAKEKPRSQISVKDAQSAWPFTRMDGKVLERLHRQVSKSKTTQYEESPF